MVDEQEMNRVADALGAAMTSGDPKLIDGILAPDFSMWYAVTNSAISRADAIRVAQQLSRELPGFRYEDIVRHQTATGFAQRHTLAGQSPSGEEFRVPACIFVEVRDGLVYRAYEYFDSAQDPRQQSARAEQSDPKSE